MKNSAGRPAGRCAALRNARAGPVERPVEPISAIGWPRLTVSPDPHQRALVVGVAGDVAVAVVDLHQLAVAGALARPGDDAGGDRDHARALVAGEVDALVEAPRGRRTDPRARRSTRR